MVVFGWCCGLNRCDDMIVNEFVDEKSLWKAARVAFESVPEGYFLKMGKRLDGKITLYWLGYPVVVKDE